MLIVGTYGRLAWKDKNASARRPSRRPAVLLERWPQVFGMNITFNNLHNTWFIFTKMNSMTFEILYKVHSTEYAR